MGKQFLVFVSLFFFYSVFSYSESHQPENTSSNGRGPTTRPVEEDQHSEKVSEKLSAAFGVSPDEVKDWVKAVQSLHEGRETAEPAHLNALFSKLSQFSDEEIKALLGDLDSTEGTSGLRKSLEVFSKLNRQKQEDLKKQVEGSDPLVSRVAKKILERKQADEAINQRAKLVREGISALNERFSKEKPSRAEMGALSDARARQRSEIGQLLEQGGRHPESQKALQAYQDALLAEKTRVIEPHQKAAIERETPSYWSHLGTELKRNYLSREGAHAGLQAAGLVPFIGEAADLIDGALYAAEGKKGEAALSFASAVPLAGIAVTASRKTVKAVGGVVDAAAHQINLSRMGARQVATEAAPLRSLGEAMSEAKWRPGITRNQAPVAVHTIESFGPSGRRTMRQEIYEIDLGNGAGKSPVVISVHDAGGAHSLPHVEVGVPKTLQPEAPGEPIRYYGNKIRIFWNDAK